jgi:hypothetical protein
MTKSVRREIKIKNGNHLIKNENKQHFRYGKRSNYKFSAFTSNKECVLAISTINKT